MFDLYILVLYTIGNKGRKKVMKKTNYSLSDALLSCGLPQLAEKLYKLNDNYLSFDTSDIELISKRIKDFDNYYKSGWKESVVRHTLQEYVNEYCSTFRCYRFLINN